MVEARQTFKKGCRLLPRGPWVLAFVSGEHADGFCPLFLKSSDEMFRAVEVQNDGCDYGVGLTATIRCL